MNEELKVIISAEIKKLKDNVNKAKQEVSSFKEQVKKAGEDVDANFAAAGESIKKGLAVGATAIAATATALLALAGSTQEYRNAQAQLATAFETAGGSAAMAKDTYNDLYRVLGDSGKATEAATHLAKLTTNEKELSQWTNIAQGVYATFTDSLPIEALTEAVNETAKVGTVTGALADALNWAGISEDAFNEKLANCNSEAEREKLIRETLNGIYSDAAATYEKNNAQVLAQNEQQAKLDENLAKVGETLAPVITALTSLANDVLTVLTPYLQDFAANYLPKIQEVLGKVGEKLEAALKFLIEHKTILAVMAGIIGGVVVAIGLYNTVAAIKAAMDAAQVTTLGALITAQLASAAATIVAIAPYLLIVAAIAAVIAIIVLLIKNWDKIKEKVVEVAGKVKDKVIEIKDNIVGKFTAAKDAVVNIFNNIVNSIKTKLDTAKNTVKNVIDKIKGFFNFSWSLPKIKTPSISINWSDSPAWMAEAAKLVGLKGVPKFSVSWNALGGVFDKPTLFNYGGSLQGIGEDGAEAVVPLEKNTQWLDRLATMLAEKQGNTPIILQVDGKTFAQISVDSINALTKQTGSLQLALV